MKKTYIFGLASGLLLATSWKFLVKEGVKVGVKVGRGIKKVGSEALEDLEDAKAEAMHDLAEEEQRSRKAEQADSVRRPRNPAVV